MTPIPTGPHLDPAPDDLEAELRLRLDSLVKPRGALGRLESLALKLGCLQQTLTPTLRPQGVVFAADHGITRAGVSAYPSAVTGLMVQTMLDGEAACSVLAQQHGIPLAVVDAGLATPINHPQVQDRSLRRGTRNFLEEPAMTRAELATAFAHAQALVDEWAHMGRNVLLAGEMGIGNSTAAACLAAKLLGLTAAQVTGPGAGLPPGGLEHKQAVVLQALHEVPHQPDPQDPLEVLRTYGGYELAMLAAAYLHAARHGMAVVVDGYQAATSALVASLLEPNLAGYLILAHQCAEPGMPHVLNALGGPPPLLDLKLCMGEGAGALLAYGLLQSSVNLLTQMASLRSVGL